MTGLSSRSHGDRIFNETLEMPDPETVPTLPGIFREAGYQAHAVGKLHVYPQRDRIGFDEVILNEEGRHHLDDGNADDWELYLAEQGYPGQEYAGGLSNNDYVTRSWHLPEHCHPHQLGGGADVPPDPAPRSQETRLLVSLLRGSAPARLAAGRISGPLPESGTGSDGPGRLVPVVRGPALQRQALHGPVLHAPGHSRRDRPGEKGLLRHHHPHRSPEFRMVLGTLRAEGLSDNTIVAFTADHGDMLGDHQMWAKGVMYEKSARVPLIIVPAAGDDRFCPGSRDRRLAELRDLMPTLLDLCGLEPPRLPRRNLTGRRRGP